MGRPTWGLHWEDHWAYLISRSDLANNGLGRDFYGVGTHVSEADWYSRGSWVQFPIGSNWNHRAGNWGSCAGSASTPHAVSLDTCVTMDAYSPKWGNGNLLARYKPEVQTSPQTSSRQNILNAAALELGEGVTCFPTSPSSFESAWGNWSNPDITSPK